MPLSPLEIQKARFAQKMRGYDPIEVENFLALVAEELTTRLAEIDRLRREASEQVERLSAGAERLRAAEERQRELQDALIRSQRVADEIVSTARREAELLVKEAELTGDKIVTQAIEQATRIETSIAELRAARREVQLKFRNTIDLFARILEADMDEEQKSATVHSLRGRRK